MGNACIVGDVITSSSPQSLTPRCSRGTPAGLPTASSTMGPSTERRSPPTQRRELSASRRVTVEDSITMVVTAPPLMTSSPRQGSIPPQNDRTKGTVEGTSTTTFEFDEKVQTSVPRPPQPPAAAAAATTRVANNFRASLANSLPSTPQSNPLAHRSSASPATSRGGWSSVVSPPPALDLRSALRGTSSHEHDDEVFEDPSALDCFDASPLGASPRTTTTSHHTSSAVRSCTVSPRSESCESTSNRPPRVSFRSYAVVMGEEEGDEDQITSPPLSSVAVVEPAAVDPTTVIIMVPRRIPAAPNLPCLLRPPQLLLRGGHSSSAHNVVSMSSVLMTPLRSSQSDMDSFFGEVGIAPSTASMLVSLPPPSPQRHQIARKKLPHSQHHHHHHHHQGQQQQQQRTTQASPPASYHHHNNNSNLITSSPMIPRHLGSVGTQPSQQDHLEPQQQVQRSVSQLNHSASISQHASMDDVTLFMKLSSASVSEVAAGGGDVTPCTSPTCHHNHSNDDLSTAAVQID
ncbi:Hypothetical protein, putative [Bodo saltans]|uniref:Uncharacterized protein n=1 Tax=Bodo saltans TaxID=75058 RepID=A0A0S4IMJ9_BODSA|nr:Hypothetical protein, putative [Bodo saltans]|eukprot:CUF47521.1 Hypothetical protein, putative [Bodo saltans]